MKYNLLKNEIKILCIICDESKLNFLYKMKKKNHHYIILEALTQEGKEFRNIPAQYQRR